MNILKHSLSKACLYARLDAVFPNGFIDDMLGLCECVLLDKVVASHLDPFDPGYSHGHK